MFDLVEKNKGFRKGVIHTKSGEIKTPFFMPIATKGSIKHLSPEEVRGIGYEVVLGNTYHLWLRPGDDLIAQAGGLHSFMNWNDSILTDSGGFQVFSLGDRAKDRFGISGVELSEEDVCFVDHLNGLKHKLSPEKSIDIQLNLGSDIIMCLDDCPAYPSTKEKTRESLELTTRWAKRCKQHLKKKTLTYKGKKPLLFGIVQGSVYKELREKSARDLVEIGFDGYAIGGVAVGEPREKLEEILSWVLPLLPEDKPRYLMGLGRPEEVVTAVSAGVDMFDCVIPTREGRHGRAFVWKLDPSQLKKEDLLKRGSSFYGAINISNKKYRRDFSALDEFCNCYSCKNYSKAYIRHLFAVGEPFGQKLVSLHNLSFYFQLMSGLGKKSK